MYSQEFCCYIYLKDNYLILTQLQITFQKRNVTVGNFIKQNIKYLENVKMYQHIYATLYPKFIYVTPSLIQRIDQSLSYAMENELTTEKAMKQELAIIKKLLLNKQKFLKIQKIIKDDLFRQLMNSN